MEYNRAIPNLPTVSASKIKVYKTCARQYKNKYALAYAERPVDDKNVAALLGTALHEAIEMYYKEGIRPTYTFQTVMNETIVEWEEQKLKINMAGYFTQAMKVGRAILEDFNWSKFNPVELELAFTLPFPNATNPIANVTGYIDLVDNQGAIYNVVDHKSTSYAPSQDELNHDPQFLLYAWAAEQLYEKKPDKIIWNHLRTHKLYYADVTTDYDDKIMQLTEDIHAMLHAKHYARRQMDSVCKTKCSFYELCYGKKAADTTTVVEDSE